MDAQTQGRHWHVRRGDGGFSFSEIILVIAVGSMIAGFGIPAFYDTVRDARLTAAANELVAALNYARSEAIKRNQTVVLCRSLDGRICAKSPGYRSDWSVGWIVFVNEDGDDRRDPEEPLLRVYPDTVNGITLSFNQRWRVNYRPNGRAKSGTFSLCDKRGPDRARAVILFWSGRPRVTDRSASGDRLDCSHT